MERINVGYTESEEPIYVEIENPESENLESGFSAQVKNAVESMISDAFYNQVLDELNEAASAGNVPSSERYDIRAEVEDRTAEVVGEIFSDEEMKKIINQNEPNEGVGDTSELPRAVAEEVIKAYFSALEADSALAAA